MGWLSKIFKGSRHKISRGQYRGKSSDNDNWNETSNSLPYSGYESVDLDHAIALSLSEEDPKNANATEFEFDVDEDEQLARALQESLDIESPPRQSIESPPRDNVESPPQQNIESPPEQSLESPPWQNGHIYQPSSFFVHTKSRICAGCKNAVGHGQFLSFMGAIWHPDCFRCYACDQPITDYEFSMYGDYPYHLSCYRDLYHPKCDVCKQFIHQLVGFWLLQNFCSYFLGSGYYKKRIRASASLLLQETSVLVSRGAEYLFACHLRRPLFQVPEVQNTWSLEGAE